MQERNLVPDFDHFEMCASVKLLAVLIAVAALRVSAACTTPTISVAESVFRNDHKHYVPEGPVHIFCSSDSNQLSFYKDEELYTNIINATTVGAVIENPTIGLIGLFKCNNTCSINYAWIQVESYPDVKIMSFHFTSIDFEVLHCMWFTITSHGNYTLSYLRKDGTLISPPCFGSLAPGNGYKFCKNSNISNFQNAESKDPSITMHLQICNILGCANRAENVDLLTITKLAAPRDLNVRKISPTKVLLEWTPYRSKLVSELDMYYVIEYWFIGMEPRVLMMTETVSRRVKSTLLKLPCSGKRYTVRISCKPARSLFGMSDFAQISFLTRSDPEATLNPICKSKPVESPSVMLYKQQVLMNYIEEQLDRLEKLKKSLREKAAAIIKLQLANKRV